MEQFRRGDLVFDLIDAGAADGPVVVLLHGFPELNSMYQPVIDRLTARGIAVWRPCSAATRPAHGRSEGVTTAPTNSSTMC